MRRKERPTTLREARSIAAWLHGAALAATMADTMCRVYMQPKRWGTLNSELSAVAGYMRLATEAAIRGTAELMRQHPGKKLREWKK